MNINGMVYIVLDVLKITELNAMLSLNVQGLSISHYKK